VGPSQRPIPLPRRGPQPFTCELWGRRDHNRPWWKPGGLSPQCPTCAPAPECDYSSISNGDAIRRRVMILLQVLDDWPKGKSPNQGLCGHRR
jgi:hypothetical protein